MPVYEFECREHGAFEILRSVAEYDQSAHCPACARQATRILSMPQLTILSRSERVARDRNEQSRHEPRLASQPGGTSSTHACGHTHAKPAAQAKLTPYTGPRPWVIEHA